MRTRCLLLLALLAAAQGVLVRSAHAIDPPVKPPASSDREAWPDDPEFTRVIFMPTAFLRPVGERTWTMTGVTLHQLHFGVGESIQLGVGALIPVGILAGSIHAKVGGSVSTPSVARSSSTTTAARCSPWV